MATVFIPAQLRDLTGGVGQLEITAQTVAQVVDQLETCYPGIRARLCPDGQLSRSLQVAVGGVLTSRGLAADVPPTAEVHFLPAIGGG